ncbi:acetaldehyde dehydrogenase (acetylating) [Wenjunlia tyrosinilytica]|uniref:Acetaldehyde dehydrogenase n=1 Tax=Wenjunlia tyrosinilytica TaxID=1544741 RepID=A0A918E0S6_9ACTN|nr:acetaldehyde dehydrogenase (acetylating) [Wenjunlia tyrosinilytica]GGO99472.1 acetaldehyde dehydrogenase 2 [Wenjunlia tyrosinilytica]
MSATVAVLGSGNIGTDLMFKVIRLSERLRLAAVAGIDPESDGLARARRLDVATTHKGVEGLVALPEFQDVQVVFDATSAGAHKHNYAVLREHGKTVVDLTPAAVGPYVVPSVNMDAHVHKDNVNMVTCGGQATIPIVAAISRVVTPAYAEIVASIASKSAGPGTRANIDEFTETTAAALVSVGGASRGKAIIVLNPADPPVVMRDTVYCLVPESADHDAINRSVHEMVAAVSQYVPGYRLKQDVQFEPRDGLTQVGVFLEVTGAAHYLPAYAGNLDIMTSAALRTAERMSELRAEEAA